MRGKSFKWCLFVWATGPGQPFLLLSGTIAVDTFTHSFALWSSQDSQNNLLRYSYRAVGWLLKVRHWLFTGTLICLHCLNKCYISLVYVHSSYNRLGYVTITNNAKYWSHQTTKVFWLLLYVYCILVSLTDKEPRSYPLGFIIQWDRCKGRDEEFSMLNFILHTFCWPKKIKWIWSTSRWWSTILSCA